MSYRVQGGVAPGDEQVSAKRNTFVGAVRQAVKFAKTWGRSVVLDPEPGWEGSVLASCEYVSRARRGERAGRSKRKVTANCHFNSKGRQLLKREGLRGPKRRRRRR